MNPQAHEACFKLEGTDSEIWFTGLMFLFLDAEYLVENLKLVPRI